MCLYNIQQVIKLSSVIGEEFEWFHELELNPVLTRKVHIGLIHRNDNGMFLFHNELIRKEIYDFIPKRCVVYYALYANYNYICDAEKMHRRVAHVILAALGR